MFHIGKSALARQSERQLMRSAEKTYGVAIERQIASKALTLEGKTLNRFDQATSRLSEVGQNNIRILRNWAKSKGWDKLPNPGGQPEKWGVYLGNKFEWKLRIKPEGSLRSGLESGSNIPRFDSRLFKDNGYINPFTGKIGNQEVGTHLPLEYFYY